MAPLWPVPSARGRPPLFTPELGAEVCRRVASGRSLRSVCTDPDMPSDDTMRRWLQAGQGDEDPSLAEFCGDYARAVEVRADFYADEAERIARECPGHSMPAVCAAKLQVDTMKWLAGVTAPRRYGRHRDDPAPADVAVGVQIILPDNGRGDGPAPVEHRPYPHAED